MSYSISWKKKKWTSNGKHRGPFSFNFFRKHGEQMPIFGSSPPATHVHEFKHFYSFEKQISLCEEFWWKLRCLLINYQHAMISFWLSDSSYLQFLSKSDCHALICNFGAISVFIILIWCSWNILIIFLIFLPLSVSEYECCL